MTHKHKWAVTMWHLVNPFGPSNEPTKYLDLEICKICGAIRVAKHSLIWWGRE